MDTRQRDMQYHLLLVSWRLLPLATKRGLLSMGPGGMSPDGVWGGVW